MHEADQVYPSGLRLVIRIAKSRRIGGLIFSIIAALVLGFPLIFILDPSGVSDVSSFIPQILLSAAMTIGIGTYVGYAIRNMWWGDTLILDEAGLRYKIYQSRGFVRWSDIKQFRLEAPLLGMKEHLGWDYKDDQAATPFTHRRLRSQGNHPTTLHGDLGPYWQGGASAVRDTLEAWQLRYATDDCLENRSMTAEGPKKVPDTMVIQCSHWKYLGYSILVSAGILGGLAAAYIVSPAYLPAQSSWWLAAGMMLIPLVILGPILWLLVRRYLSRPQITLNTSGFELRDDRGVRFTPWTDIDTFGLIYHPQSHRQTVGWRLKKRTDANRFSTEMDEDCGGGFDGAPEALRDVLEDWRIRFS